MITKGLREASITLPPPLTTLRPIPLQLLLRVHQASLHPHTVLFIVPYALAVQQVRQRALDLLVDVLEFALLLLDLSEDGVIDDGGKGAASLDHAWPDGRVGGGDAVAMVMAWGIGEFW